MMATYLFVCVLLSKISVYQIQYEDMNMVLQQLSVRPDQSVLKVAYNSGMFDNSHLLIMQYFFLERFVKIF